MEVRQELEPIQLEKQPRWPSVDTFSTIDGGIGQLTDQPPANPRREPFRDDEAAAAGGDRAGGAVPSPETRNGALEHSSAGHSGACRNVLRAGNSTTTEQGVQSRESNYEFVLGVVNPAAGEVSAGRHVLRSMRVLLGPERVIVLNGAVFANPSSLQDAIRNFSVRFEQETSNGCGELPDGTAKIEKRGTVLVSGGDGTVSFVMEQVGHVRETLEGIAAARSSDPQGLPSERFILPAVSVFALGTGNDLSRSLGFGGGYSLNMCCRGCVDDAIRPLFDAAIVAPAVPFDRWIVRLAPKESIQEQWRNQNRVQQEQTNVEAVHSTTDPIDQLRLVEWDALDAGGKCLRYNFMNYFSVGYDAYVLRKFERFRRRHPEICRKRWANKLVYASYGLREAFSCSTLRRKIPAICVPGFTQPTTRGNEYAISPALPPLTRLTVPADSKVLLVSNVDRYAAGTRPWRGEKGRSSDSLKMLTPVSINDHKIEVQALGGIADMALLQLGMGTGGKLAQSREIFMFFFCTPEDVFRPSDTGGNSRTQVKKKGERESLCVQVDGEAVTKIVQPTVAHVTELRNSVIYVRCRNPAVVRQTSRSVITN